MSITVELSTALRSYCSCDSELSLEASTVRGALEELESHHVELYHSVCDDTGAVRRHVNLFLNSSILSKTEGLDRPLSPGDVLTMPGIAVDRWRVAVGERVKAVALAKSYAAKALEVPNLGDGHWRQPNQHALVDLEVGEAGRERKLDGQNAAATG